MYVQKHEMQKYHKPSPTQKGCLNVQKICTRKQYHKQIGAHGGAQGIVYLTKNGKKYKKPKIPEKKGEEKKKKKEKKKGE